MADIFRSSKQPSLFPLLISSPQISKQDYILFYRNERSLFTILLVILHREVVQSILVMGFLLWLERECYTSKNLVEIFVNSLTPDLIDHVADEVVMCLKFIEKKSNYNLLFEATSKSHEIPLLQCYLDRKRINLNEFHQNRDLIFDEVSCMANEVANKAFDDILEQFIRCGEPFVLHSPREVNVGGGVGGFRYVGPAVPFPSYDITKYVGYHQTSTVGEDANQHALLNLGIYLNQQRNSSLNHLHSEALSPSVIIRDPQEEIYIPPENRTIFLTFSKGYPISESEVRNYFTRMFGDFIESIYMQPVEPDDQPLFARIVAHSPSMVRAVVNRDGVDGKSKYYINGKHVWARKYVKRTPSARENGEGPASPQM